MSKYEESFNKARNHFRSQGVSGQDYPDNNQFRPIETASSAIETDHSRHVMLDDDGNVVVGSKAIKTKMPKDQRKGYAIIDTGLEEKGKFITKANGDFIIPSNEPRPIEDLEEEERMNGRQPRKEKSQDYGSDID